VGVSGAQDSLVQCVRRIQPNNQKRVSLSCMWPQRRCHGNVPHWLLLQQKGIAWKVSNALFAKMQEAKISGCIYHVSINSIKIASLHGSLCPQSAQHAGLSSLLVQKSFATVRMASLKFLWHEDSAHKGSHQCAVSPAVKSATTNATNSDRDSSKGFCVLPKNFEASKPGCAFAIMFHNCSVVPAISSSARVMCGSSM